MSLWLPHMLSFLSPPQSCPPWVCRPAAARTSSGLPPGWSLLWSSGTGPWCCCSGCTRSLAPSRPSTRTDAPEARRCPEWGSESESEAAPDETPDTWAPNAVTLEETSLSECVGCWRRIWRTRCLIKWTIHGWFQSQIHQFVWQLLRMILGVDGGVLRRKYVFSGASSSFQTISRNIISNSGDWRVSISESGQKL